MFPSNVLDVFLILPFLFTFTYAYDVVVYGGNAGGIAAAITAARAAPNFKIAIVEPSAYIGGMAFAGGIGLRDLGEEGTRRFIIPIKS